MNVCFYNSLTRIPLGVAVTIEALGPLALSVVVSQRKTSWLWALLALLGVALLSLTGVRVGHLDPVGLGFAAGAAASWAAYILATARAGSDFPNLDGLALATAIGALVTAPFAAGRGRSGTARLRWQVLGLGAIVGVMSSVIPYSLELISLRRLPPETFAILTCLSPVVAAIAGWLILGQHLAVTGYVAIVLVTVASIGAVRAARDRLAQSDTRTDHRLARQQPLRHIADGRDQFGQRGLRPDRLKHECVHACIKIRDRPIRRPDPRPHARNSTVLNDVSPRSGRPDATWPNASRSVVTVY